MMGLDVQDTRINVRKSERMKQELEMIMTFALDASFSIQLVHFAPVMEIIKPSTPRIMEMMHIAWAT